MHVINFEFSSYIKIIFKLILTYVIIYKDISTINWSYNSMNFT